MFEQISLNYQSNVGFCEAVLGRTSSRGVSDSQYATHSIYPFPQGGDHRIVNLWWVYKIPTIKISWLETKKFAVTSFLLFRFSSNFLYIHLFRKRMHYSIGSWR